MSGKTVKLLEGEFLPELNRIEAAFGIHFEDAAIAEWYQAVNWLHAGRLHKLVDHLIRKHERLPMRSNIAGMLLQLNKSVPYAPKEQPIANLMDQVLEQYPMPPDIKKYWDCLKAKGRAAALEENPEVARMLAAKPKRWGPDSRVLDKQTTEDERIPF